MFAILLHKFHISEMIDSWDISQNTLGQSDCRILNINTSQEQNDEMTWFFLQIHGNWKLNQKYWGRVCQKWLWPLRFQDSQTGSISRRNWWKKVLHWLHVDTNPGKLKVNYYNYWVGMVKNGHRLLSDSTVKSAVS